jgi:hypothetical protein
VRRTGRSPDPRSHEGAKSREQLAETKWLRQVVVRAGVESLDPVRDSSARGEEEDRHPAAGRTQTTADFETVEVRQHHVEDDGVVRLFAPEPQSALTGGFDIDDVPFLFETPTKKGGHTEVVFYNEDTHRGRKIRPR